MERLAAASSLALLRSCGPREVSPGPRALSPGPRAPSPAPPSGTSSRASPAPDHGTNCCIFCSGLVPVLTTPTYNKRKRSLTSLSQFVSARCQPTPHAFPYFSAVRGEEKVLLCISCVNWQRRACGGGRKRQTKKPMLLIDQVAVFMLQPGIILFPDQRCVLRLLAAMREPGDDWVPKLLFGLMPVPVQTMIGMMPSPPCGVDESVHSVIVRVWWEYNGRTVFFAHHLTAKLIRKSLKRSPEQPGPTAAPPLPYYADEDLEQTDLGLVDPRQTDPEQIDTQQTDLEQMDPELTDFWPGDCQSTFPDPLPGHEPGC